MRTENYPREAYLAHTLRDPNHAYGGYIRFVKVPDKNYVKQMVLANLKAGHQLSPIEIAAYEEVAPKVRHYYMPRNPGRWRPGNPNRFPEIALPESRQVIRARRRRNEH